MDELSRKDMELPFVYCQPMNGMKYKIILAFGIKMRKELTSDEP